MDSIGSQLRFVVVSVGLAQFVELDDLGLDAWVLRHELHLGNIHIL